MTEVLTKKELAKQYVKASVHYGHPPKEWNPKMAPYILSEKYGYHLFDLVKTSKLLRLAGNVLQKKAEKGGTFLFVGTNKLSSSLIAREATRSNSFYVNKRWLGGMLTNWTTVRKQIERLTFLEEQESTGESQKLSKRELGLQRKEIEKLKKVFQGVQGMTKLPDVVIFTNQKKDIQSIRECLRLGIPAICVVDSNCDPDLIPYPIPANDDSSSSISFLLTYLSDQILKGYQKNMTYND